jgi:hypothetical protein
MRRRPSLLLAALAVALASGACRRTDGPAEAYRRFAAAARSGDAEAVWALLSSDTRAALDTKARDAAAHAPPGVVPASGKELVIGDYATRAPRLKSVVVVRESADRAVVAAEDESGAKQEVTLVREGGAWRVVVPVEAGG